MFDVAIATFLLPVLVGIALALLVLNPFFNRGPLMYYQCRMGHGGAPFRAFKFRTMIPATASGRGAYDALEEDRISRMGRVMRKLRIDELPQIINVLRREMSLIGPRPDLYDHARIYMESVPGYAARQQMMPGISGYAQTEVGYVDGKEGIKRKVAADLYYLVHASFRFDLWIAWRTLCVIAGRKGR
ncbi:sugar transferase [Yoonia sp. GPGPB17]|uniref:sugar transferase n=1 Tax=Yoonia sp. GPGPB17 TaxID=3026147 RepID=UPI0030C439FA